MSYFVIRVYVIGCDVPGCEEFADDVVSRGRSKRRLDDARREVARAGWTYVNGQDLCPAHSKAAKR